ncbi:hypothetical protein D9611_005237 [Ephemerocybe angulata]|uniref:Uncharacterized protein n=1 Tax=Ephemerocybe angulata TaxID=980116 RepID=A0A8H5FD56_9AGAR|nr:hypothetical protein D9611_005237 [Tulosesus angulatus]
MDFANPREHMPPHKDRSAKDQEAIRITVAEINEAREERKHRETKTENQEPITDPFAKPHDPCGNELSRNTTAIRC